MSKGPTWQRLCRYDVKYRIHYKADNQLPMDVECDFLKYDAGVVLLIREVDGKSRVVAVVNTEAIRAVVEYELQKV